MYQTLKQDLVSGAFALGDPLNANDLAEALSTSRQPVMDALKRLQGEGLVDILPQIGCQVAMPTAADVEDFYEVFATLEGLITSMAARRRPDAAVERLVALAESLPTVATGDRVQDNRRYAEANRSFHGAVHELAASPEARRAAEFYWDRSDFLIASLRPPFWQGAPEVAHHEHKAIARFVGAREAEPARLSASEHIRRFGTEVAARLRAGAAQGEP